MNEIVWKINPRLGSVELVRLPMIRESLPNGYREGWPTLKIVRDRFDNIESETLLPPAVWFITESPPKRPWWRLW